MTELQGERVTLRTLDVADVPRLRELRPRGWASEADWPLEGSRSTRYTILLDGSVVGFIQSHENPEPEYRHAGIDIFVGTPYHGQGIGTDAVRTLAVHLVRDLGHHRIVIDPRADNAAAIRCYRKVGFTPVGVMRRYERNLETGEWNDGLLMDMLAEELDTSRTAPRG
ncbi:GNAT family N-acetyltransferase [Actinopolymorpha alba]|uniref:GNAT family N-acetyltransferase n=1 Tax=Actinopolymorpha alba TaxID=533267 RepID=UPI000369CF7A|nr:GNAT family protein [Actinopolymorpha alba]